MEKGASRIVRSCFHPAASCTACATGLSLDATQTIKTTNSARRSQRTIRRFRGRRGNSAGGTSTAGASAAAAPFAGEHTGLPHFKQNCAPSGRLVPHLAQAKIAVATGGAVAVAGALTFCPHFRQNWDPSGRLAAHLLHNTADSLRSGNDSRY